MRGCELVVGEADDQAEDEVAAEPEHHSVSAAEAVAEEGAEEDAGEGEGTEEKLPFTRLLDVGGFGDGGDDLAGEDAVGKGDEVVAGDELALCFRSSSQGDELWWSRERKHSQEPSTASANQRPPIIPQHKSIRHPSLNRASPIQLRIQHLQPKVENRQRPNAADSERDTPQRVQMLHACGLQHDQED